MSADAPTVPTPKAFSTDPFALVGAVLDRKFRIERMVAEGGFGVVYYATHLTLDKPVAVKVLKTPPEFNSRARAEFVEKFALEGKTMARMHHPNIVQVLDFGASTLPSGDVAAWMVLEWLTGQTLEALLYSRRGSPPFSAAETLHVLRPVFEAVAFAHEEGIVHRDIKPANIMAVAAKRGSTLRLMDFGIAKLMADGESAGTGSTRTRTRLSAFSPNYAAPEQVSGTRTGPWTDVHALALIVTEMVTTKPAYESNDMTTLYGQILSPTRPTPAARGVHLGAWEPIIARALSIKPDVRFQSAGEFLAALESSVSLACQRDTAAVSTWWQASSVAPAALAASTLRGASLGARTARNRGRAANVPGALAALLLSLASMVGTGLVVVRGHAAPHTMHRLEALRGASTELRTLSTSITPPLRRAPAQASPTIGSNLTERNLVALPAAQPPRALPQASSGSTRGGVRRRVHRMQRNPMIGGPL